MTRTNTWFDRLVALVVIGTLASTTMLGSQEPQDSPARTEKGLYLLKVVEPGYDVTIRETERASSFSIIEIIGVVPTVTAGGVMLFRAAYDIARERGFEHTFAVRVGDVQAPGSSARGSDGRRVDMLVKVFLTNDSSMPLRDLLGSDYSREIQEMFNQQGYMSVNNLAILFGGR